MNNQIINDFPESQQAEDSMYFNLLLRIWAINFKKSGVDVGNVRQFAIDTIHADCAKYGIQFPGNALLECAHCACKLPQGCGGVFKGGDSCALAVGGV